MPCRAHHSRPRHSADRSTAVIVQQGVALVEMALVLPVIILLVFGILELARTAWTAHAAQQAAAQAAQRAARCGVSAPVQDSIRRQITPLLEASGQLNLGSRSDWLVLTPWPQSCTDADCRHVQVQLRGLVVGIGAGALALTIDVSPPVFGAVREDWGQSPQSALSCLA